MDGKIAILADGSRLAVKKWPVIRAASGVGTSTCGLWSSVGPKNRLSAARAALEVGLIQKSIGHGIRKTRKTGEEIP
jgi:hypothetical protein